MMYVHMYVASYTHIRLNVHIFLIVWLHTLILFHDLYRGICSVKKNDKYRDRLEKYFKPLATSYLEICEKQQPKEFFGLRDFYRYVYIVIIYILVM